MSDIKDLWYDWLGVNTWLFKKINSISGEPIYNGLMKGVSFFGKQEMIPYFIVAIALYAAGSIIWRVFAKKGGNKYYTLMWVNIFIIMGAGFYMGKQTIDYLHQNSTFARPYIALKKAEVKQLEAKPAQEANRSFPSVHVAIVTVFIVAIWPALNENFRWGGIGIITAVAWSRMALGVSFPMDVLSGFAIILFEMLLLRFVYYGLINRIFKTGF